MKYYLSILQLRRHTLGEVLSHGYVIQTWGTIPSYEEIYDEFWAHLARINLRIREAQARK